MLIKAKLNESWVFLTPEFDNFKIKKYRDKTKLLQIRYEAQGNLIFFGNDYDNLIDFVENDNIECQIIEQTNGDGYFNCYLNLEKEQNLTTNFLKGKISIIDDYYEFYNGKRTISTDINIKDVQTEHLVMNLGAQDEIKAVQLYTPFCNKITEIVKFLAGKIATGTWNVRALNCDNFFYDIVFLHENYLKETNYFDNRDTLMKNYYSENPSLSSFWANIADMNIDDEINISFENLLNYFEILLNYYWYVSKEQLSNYVVIQQYANYYENMINGINLTTYLGVDWEAENEIIINFADKVKSILINNSTIKLYKQIHANLRYRVENPFYTKEIVYKNNNSDLTKELSQNYTTNFVGNAISGATQNEIKEQVVQGNGLIDCNTGLDFWSFRNDYLYCTTAMLSTSNGSDLNFPLLSGYYTGLSDNVTMNLVLENVNKRKISYTVTKTSGQTAIIVSKWIFIRQGERIEIISNSNQKINIRMVVADGSSTYTPVNVSNVSGYYITTPNIIDTHYYQIRITILGLNTTGDIQLRMFNCYLAKKTTLTDYNYLFYNAIFSTDSLITKIFNKPKGNADVISYQHEYFDSEITVTQGEYYKSQIIFVPLNLNLSDINFNERMFTKSLGWCRVDEVEREYNKDFEGICKVTLTQY